MVCHCGGLQKFYTHHWHKANDTTPLTGTNGTPSDTPPTSLLISAPELGDRVGGSAENPPNQHPNRPITSSMTATSLFANLFTDGRDSSDPTAGGPTSSQASIARSETPEVPLFEPDPPSPIGKDQVTTEQGPLPPPSPMDNEEDGPQVGIELHLLFKWLVDLLAGLRVGGWGSAYRDFMEVRFLLHGVQALGMVEWGNDRVSDCILYYYTVLLPYLLCI
jgi:hypothetical protein